MKLIALAAAAVLATVSLAPLGVAVERAGLRAANGQESAGRGVCADSQRPEPASAPTGPTWSAARLGLEHTAGLSQGTGQLVAVLDTGVSAVPAVAGAVRPAIDLLPPLAADRTVPTDVVPVAPAAVDAGDSADCDGRGTALAGLIAASRGPGAVLPGLARGAEILPVRVTAAARELPEPAVLAQGMTAAVAAGATVLLVAGAVRDDPALQAATESALNAGVPVVAAAGDGDDDALAFPASYDGVIAVAATGPQDDVRPVNAVGLVTVGAPGVDLVGFGLDGGFVAGLAGTAFAGANVAAAVADLRARYPGLTPRELRQRLIDTADRPAVTVPDPTLGWGVINPVTALTAPAGAVTAGAVVAGAVAAGAVADPSSAAAPLPAVVVDLPPVPDNNNWAVTVAVLLLVLAGGIAALVAGVRRAHRRGWRPGGGQSGGGQSGGPPPATRSGRSSGELVPGRSDH